MQTPRTSFQATRHTPPPAPQQKNGNQAPITGKACFNCGEEGYFANKCPKKRPVIAQGQYNNNGVKQGQTQNQGRNGNQAPVQGNRAQHNYVRGKVNHVTAEEAQDAQNVVLGMFLVNSNSALVLFDSGASHSFITTQYIAKYNLPITSMNQPMLISSAGGEMRAKYIHPKIRLKIRE